MTLFGSKNSFESCLISSNVKALVCDGLDLEIEPDLLPMFVLLIICLLLMFIFEFKTGLYLLKFGI